MLKKIFSVISAIVLLSGSYIFINDEYVYMAEDEVPDITSIGKD